MTISGVRLVLVACTVLAALTVVVVVHPGPLPGEVEYIRWLQRRGEPLASIADFVRHTTSTLANLIVLAVPAVLAAKRYGRPARQAVVIALAAMLAVQPMYKEVVDRPRPDETQVEVRAEHSSKSFPSGHSLGTATVWGAAAGLAWDATPPRDGGRVLGADRRNGDLQRRAGRPLAERCRGGHDRGRRGGLGDGGVDRLGRRARPAPTCGGAAGLARGGVIGAFRPRTRPGARRRGPAGRPVPQSSRAECMLSCGTPTSTVSMPSRVAVIGPIVEPQGMLLRDTNVWCGTSAASQARRKSAAVADDVA